MAQLRWGDVLIARGKGRISNPPGFYAYLIKEDVVPPAASEPVQQTLSEAFDPPAAGRSEEDYEEHCRQIAIAWLAQRYSPEDYRLLLDQKMKEIGRQYPAAQFWSEAQLVEVAEGLVRGEALKHAQVPTFSQFREVLR